MKTVSCWAALCILLLVMPSAVLVQTTPRGMDLFNQARKLQLEAHSAEDLEKAVRSYQQARKIFEKLGKKKAVSACYHNLGSIYKDWGQYARALDYYTKALDLRSSMHDSRGIASTLIALGNLSVRQGKYHKARQYYKKALTVNLRLKDLRGEARCLTSMGNVSLHHGKYKEASAYYERSLPLARKLGDKKLEAMNLKNLGTVCRKLGRYDQALKLYETSAKIESDLDNQKGQAQVLMNMGIVYWTCGEYEKAAAHYSEALMKRQRLKDREGESHCLANLGNLARSFGLYDDAVNYYNKALAISRDLKDLKAEAAVVNNLATVYKAWGQFDRALRLYTSSLEIKKKLGDQSDSALTLVNIGSLYKEYGSYGEALKFFQRALQMRKATGDRKGEANTLIRIGEICEHFGKHKEALERISEGLTICRAIGIPSLDPRRLMAGICLEMDDMQMAESIIKDLREEYKDKPHEAGLWASSGRLFLAQRNFTLAKESYEKLLREAERRGSVRYLFTAYTGLGKVYEALKDYEQAEKNYAQGAKITEEIRSSLLPSERRNFFDVKIEGFSRSEPAEGLTRVLLKTGRPARSIESGELTRARAFSDRLAVRSETGFVGVPTKILEQEERLLIQVATLKKMRRSALVEKNSRRVENLTRELAKAESELRTFVEMLWKEYKSYAAVKYPRPIALEDAPIGPDEYVLVLDVLGEGVGAILIKGTSVVEASYREWKSDDLERTLVKFLASFHEGRLEQYDPELGQSIYHKLMQHLVEKVPPGIPIIIIPDGILSVLPFEGLTIGGKVTWVRKGTFPSPEGLTYLGDAHPVSYSQSITALARTRSFPRGQSRDDRSLVFADPVFSYEDARCQAVPSCASQTAGAGTGKEPMSLPSRLDVSFPRIRLTGELGEYLKELDPKGTTLFLGMKATKSELYRSLHEDYRYVVFATHGYYGSEIRGVFEPIIVLTTVNQPQAEDGFIRMTEVMGLKFGADLVALTACQTGLGKFLPGEGVMSMGRAFQYAGSRTVLMSLWSVAEQSSVQLVSHFFKELRNGRSKAQALMLARKEVRKQGFDHPFFWAPFILVGEVD